MSKKVGVNCQILAISQIAKPRFSSPFYPSPPCWSNCISSTLRFACIPRISAVKKGMSFNGFLWMTFHLGKKRAPLVQIQRNHPSTKAFLLPYVSLEFQRRTWNFSVSILTAAHFLCPFKTRKHYRQWNNCSYFSWVQNGTKLQPANAYPFMATMKFMIIGWRIHFPSKQGYGYQQQQLYFASQSSC